MALAGYFTLSSLRRPTFWGEGQKVGRRRLDKVKITTKVHKKQKEKSKQEGRRRLDKAMESANAI